MSSNGSPSSLFNLFFPSIGVEAGLQPSLPVSFNKSKVYYRWEINRPFFECAISIPRKYFK